LVQVVEGIVLFELCFIKSIQSNDWNLLQPDSDT